MRRYKIEDKMLSEINITPLTDIALVLLIIFMVTTPLIMQGGINVKLPTAVTADTSPQANITISITVDNKIYINDKEIDFTNLQGSITDTLKTQKERLIIISADRAVTHGKVIQVLDIAKRAGALKLALAAEKIIEK
jgi:biopolymer transport protein ExbD